MRYVVLVALALAALAGPVWGETRHVKVELNKLEPNGEACRAYLVLENQTDSAFETLKLDLVLFDVDGIVAKRLAVETAPLPPGKTSLKVFDVRDLTCDRVGRVLLNDVMTYSGARENCLALVSTSARDGLELVK